MAWQTSTINPATTSPAQDISKIVNDLSVLKGVIGGTPDAAVPSTWTTALAALSQAFNSGTTGGTSTAYTLTPSQAITAYSAGMTFWVTFHTACGAAPTLQVSGIASPANLVKQLADGTFANLAASDIPTNHRSRVTLLSATQALVEDMPLGSVAGSGGLTIGGLLNLGSTGQLKFPATQNASSDANTLDDYEEGTFTPSYAATGTNPSVTYDNSNTWGLYTKVGNKVYFSLEVRTTAVASGGSGDLLIAGLPFTSVANRFHSCAVSMYRVALNASCSFYTAEIQNAAAFMIIRGSVSSGVVINIAPTDINNVNPSLIRVSGCYTIS